LRNWKGALRSRSSSRSRAGNWTRSLSCPPATSRRARRSWLCAAPIPWRSRKRSRSERSPPPAAVAAGFGVRTHAPASLRLFFFMTDVREALRGRTTTAPSATRSARRAAPRRRRPWTFLRALRWQRVRVRAREQVGPDRGSRSPCRTRSQCRSPPRLPHPPPRPPLLRRTPPSSAPLRSAPPHRVVTQVLPPPPRVAISLSLFSL
jgi:hypothetical protein